MGMESSGFEHAFLQNRLPELAAHVDAHVAHLTDALKKEVDEDVAEQFLRQGTNQTGNIAMIQSFCDATNTSPYLERNIVLH
ncbi:hypothetical protein AK812_SmicGene23012 [Symbiodinium microadriaticum]|uniref:Uncharacterized protein n=1 Tax=Symbiodinium microadriaticum TaxID=2951 RepID=A0A1Q9DIA8_SYMMI|nr:hypothetical protein AK812_SmicGene23012 [Symbiodinium microadriaticum]